LAVQRPSRFQVSKAFLDEFLSHQPAVIDHTRVAAPRKTNLQRSGAVGTRGKCCKCGRCRRCLDNARWDRIFSEKFADPGYYPLKVSHNSSLAGV
jgi:hypothetical protein